MTEDLIAFGALIVGLGVIGLSAYAYQRYLKEREKPLRRRHF